MPMLEVQRPLRVLMLAPGISPHAVRPLKWLLQAGLDVCFFDVNDPGLEKTPGYTYVKMSRVPFLDTLCSILGGGIGIFLFCWANKKQLKQIENTFSPDIVHVHFVDYRAIVADRLFQCPKVLSLWGSDLNGLFAKFQKWRLKSFVKVYFRAAKIVVDAESMLEKVRVLTKERADVVNIHLGVDVELIREKRKKRNFWRKKINADDDSIVIFSPRRWTHIYGHHIISAAIKTLATLTGNKKIIVVWKKSPGLPLAKAEDYFSDVMKAQTGANDKVRNVVLGELEYDDFVGLLASADILVNFPTMDAFPVLFLEAAICRIPVVTISHDAYRGTFAEKNYICCEKYEPRALANALYRQICLLGSKELDECLDAAEAAVESCYSQDVFQQRLLECYSSLHEH